MDSSSLLLLFLLLLCVPIVDVDCVRTPYYFSFSLQYDIIPYCILYLLPHRIILLLPSSIYECATPLATAIRVVLLPPSNRIIVAPSIVSVPVVFVAHVIIDAGVYYLLQASTLHLLLLLYYYYYVVVHL